MLGTEFATVFLVTRCLFLANFESYENMSENECLLHESSLWVCFTHGLRQMESLYLPDKT